MNFLLEKNKSAISYFGSKYSLIDDLLKHFPPKNQVSTFIDLFCGSAVVTVNVKYQKRIANDIEHDLIEMYQYIQKTSFNNLKYQIYKIVKKYKLFDINLNGYLQLRNDFNKRKHPMKLFILISVAHNNLYRFNKLRQYNAAYSYKPFNEKNALFKLKHFKQYIVGVNFISKHFSQIRPTKRSFVYADPPYLITNADYNKFWNEKEEIKLLKYLDDLDKKNIKFALSNVLTHAGKTNKILMKWSKKYNIVHFKKIYNITKKDEFKNTDEVLIFNYNIK